ncbi:LysM peptidoglycan-binding domain-containing protein [Alicyclobacillus sp. SO9]|uniref:LysM peptidoglycan-binding domain-containing protein n=1 Tax=Alicyclobacillus sp. SO9 TaxID=2665646 RepID=UPI0018E774F5|nr:LysM peptidoglycan-binding domain-containing protein [Alicyclobacillus sp. SO9]QQE77766.1 LysM peptidoglycan-binding domain-containing protein [Alicyclobacillus sp. SO9]
MFIYTVRQGDSISSIAKKFKTLTPELRRLNGLPASDTLVPGLHLLIPGRTYIAEPHTVSSGDSLEKIARKSGVTKTELSYWLGVDVNKPRLTTGRTIYIPKLLRRKRQIEANTYLLPSGAQKDAVDVKETSPMTYLSLFSYQSQADGTLKDLPDEKARQAASQANIASLMTVTNFDGNKFNTSLAHTLLSNTSLRNKLETNIVDKAKSNGFKGANVDFEHMHPDDRPLYNDFIRSLGEKLHKENLTVSIAMGPKTKDEPGAAWMGAFDYKALGAAVDYLMLMTYEWGWVGGPPMTTNLLHCINGFLEVMERHGNSDFSVFRWFFQKSLDFWVGCGIPLLPNARVRQAWKWTSIPPNQGF